MICAGKSYLEEQLNSYFQRYDAALDCNGYRMSAVVGSEFSKDRLHMAFHSLFSNGKMRRNNFIRVACSDFKEHFQFARGKSVRRMMFSHGKSNLRWNSLLARVHAADGIYEILPQSAFEEVPAGSCIESLGGLDITFIRRQHDDASIGKFFSNCDGRDDAIHLWHHYIHECYVGMQLAEGFDRLTTITCFADQDDVSVILDDCRYPLSKNGMVVNG